MLMPIMHFLVASIVFIFLYNVLYSGVGIVSRAFGKDTALAKTARRSLAVSMAISIVFFVVIWYLFGVVLGVTLP